MKIKKHKVTTKLAISYASIIVVLIIGVSILFYENDKRNIYRNGISNADQLVKSAISQVDSRINDLEQTTIDVLGDNKFLPAWQAFAAGRTPADQKCVSRILCAAYKNKSDIRRVAVFNRDGSYVCTGHYAATAENVAARFAYIRSLNQTNRLNTKNFLKPHRDFWDRSSGITVVSECKPIISTDNTVIGYVEVQQNISYLKQICQLHFNGQPLDTMIWFGPNDELFYSDVRRHRSPAYLETIQAQTRQYSSFQVSGGSYIFTQPSNQYEGRVVAVIRKEILFKQLGDVRTIVILVALGLILFTLGYTLVVTRVIMRPIHTFVNFISHVDLLQENSCRNMVVKDKETAILMKSFNDMTARFQEAIKARKKLEEVQTKTLFGALQSEMSPHFLYNTLGSIANMCELGENEKAADACYSLTEILRYASDYINNEVCIAEEIGNLQSYLAIMQSRYRQRLIYEFRVDEDTSHFIIPKLTYQPLVENAIKYSLLEQEQVLVKIYTVLFGDQMIIEIKDNGCGISPADDRKIREKVDDYQHRRNTTEVLERIKFGGLGLVGTLIRLTIFFGEDFSYKLLNNNDEGGTTIVLNINMKKNK